MPYISDFFIKDVALRNLYEKLNLFITTYYPYCLVNVNNKSVSYAYPGEYARIFVFQNKDKSSLVIVISQNISKKINAENGVAYKVSSTEDLNQLKSGIRVIMELHPYKG